MPSDTTRRGYPLVALFALITVCAVVFGLASPLVRAIVAGELGWVEFGAVVIYGSFISMSIGAFVGWHHHRQPFGILWGAKLGALLGPFMSAAVLVPVNHIASLFWVAIGGSALLVALGFGVRVNTRR